MSKSLRPVSPFIILVIAMLACASPLSGGGDQPPSLRQALGNACETVGNITR